MLLLVDKHNKNRSTYKCDRCGRIVDVKEKVGIFTQKYLQNYKKYCDLCLPCYKAFVRGIEKGAKNEQSR